MEPLEHQTLIPLPDELRGPRVLLRPYRAGDAEALFEAVQESREHLRPWMPWADGHQTIEDSREYVNRSAARWVLREDLSVGVWEARGRRYLGGSGMHRINWRLRRFEIGYWLRASAEGQGYVTETVHLLTNLAFDRLDANRVEIRCDARNMRSAAVAERLGFLREARLRNNELAADGSLRDTLIFALVRADRHPPEPER
jgi:RimJ/RimL family protein N-acetyltransferase